MKGYPKWFLYKWMPSLFKDIEKKRWLEVPKITIPFRQTIGVFPWLLCRAMPGLLPAAPGGFMNPVGLGWWVQPMGSLPTAPAGQSSWQRKEPQQIACVSFRCFYASHGIGWNDMKSPHDSEISVVKQPQVAQPTFSTHLSAQHGLFSECSDETGVQCLCPKRLAARWYFFLSILVVCFPSMEVLPIFMGGLLLLQTRSFGQTPLANVLSVYPWEKLIQDHNFNIKHVGTHLFK